METNHKLESLMRASVAPGPYLEGYGITLRQHFAGLAMAAFVASFRHGNEALNVDGVAKISVMQADALLAELAKET